MIIDAQGGQGVGSPGIPVGCEAPAVGAESRTPNLVTDEPSPQAPRAAFDVDTGGGTPTLVLTLHTCKASARLTHPSPDFLLSFSALWLLLSSLSSLSFLSFSDSISYGGIRYLAPSFLEIGTRDPDNTSHLLKVTKLLSSRARTESGHDYFST